MSIRLMIVGLALVVVGLLNLGGFGKITATAGAVALIGGAITWLLARRKSPTTRR